MNLSATVACSLTALALCLACAGSGPKGSVGPQDNSDEKTRLDALSPAQLPGPSADPTNAYLADPRAAVLGKKLFFDRRFSGPLLDEANNGDPGTLGLQGETGKVACSSCHIPKSQFSDTRSSRGQISLASGWTHRRTKSLLDVAQASLLNWDGRRDSGFSQPFTPIEDPVEFNSSRLFVAQQIARLYRADYEAIFGPMPSLAGYAAVAASDAGCAQLPENVVHGTCIKPGYDDADVTRVVVNMGKAIQAYTRQLSCGQSRFDAWVAGDETALSADEQAGARLFVGKGGCDSCHSGPFLTDHRFHNVGLHPDFVFFVVPIDDHGAADGLPAMVKDPLNSKGVYSDGYDGRLDHIPTDLSTVVDAFSTPGLRCVSRRPSFMHTGQFRSLEDVVIFFNNGGNPNGYSGRSENFPRGLTADERAQLVAFLNALDGPGPDPSLIADPDLPPDPTP
ncbi:MAG: cytochrome c peroxidase [Pseudomonadota bacterium]